MLKILVVLVSSVEGARGLTTVVVYLHSVVCGPFGFEVLLKKTKTS